MMARWWVRWGPRSEGCRSWTSCARAWRSGIGPGGGGAVGVAGVVEDVAERDAGGGHAEQDGGQGAGRVEAAGSHGHPAGQLGDGRACFLARHGAGGQAVAEEQLAPEAAQIPLLLPPPPFLPLASRPPLPPLA